MNETCRESTVNEATGRRTYCGRPVTHRGHIGGNVIGLCDRCAREFAALGMRVEKDGALIVDTEGTSGGTGR